MLSVKITNPSQNDIKELKNLWKEVFKDTDSYIDLFFNVKFKLDNTFVVKENDKIISMLFLEENEIVIKDKTYKGAYLSGIATREDKRKKGYAKKLIEHALLTKTDIDIFYLIPANKELFSYYEKFGFKPFTFLEEVKIEKKNVTIPDFSEEFSYEKTDDFYKNMGNNLYVKRNKEDFSAIYDCYKNIMLFDNGYIIYYIEKNLLKIIEYTIPFDEAKNVGAYIIEKNNLEDGVILKRGGNIPFTAYKSEFNFDDIENKYINLMLN